MLTITNTSVAREAVLSAFRRSHDVRLRERYHAVLLVLDGKTCPDIASGLLDGSLHLYSEGLPPGEEGNLRPFLRKEA